MAVTGLVVGYLLGCALALRLAENELDRYANVIALKDDATAKEAHSVLAVLNDPHFPFCSDSEIAYFRELVFRSDYIKDAGRIQGGARPPRAIRRAH
jgi:sensor c-di-GMP phosphodiesterase-like protein